jgi:hypothetical protein
MSIDCIRIGPDALRRTHVSRGSQLRQWGSKAYYHEFKYRVPQHYSYCRSFTLGKKKKGYC